MWYSLSVRPNDVSVGISDSGFLHSFSVAAILNEPSGGNGLINLLVRISIIDEMKRTIPNQLNLK